VKLKTEDSSQQIKLKSLLTYHFKVEKRKGAAFLVLIGCSVTWEKMQMMQISNL